MKKQKNFNTMIKKWAPMKNFIQKKETFEEIKVQEYIKKYVKELQRHFDMSDNKIRMVLYRVYKELAPWSFIKKTVYMVKSFYNNIKFKKDNNGT